MTRQTLEQQRAQNAWKCASNAQEALKDGYDKYVALAKALPALIMNSGVMQVVAYLHEKSLDNQTKLPKPNDHHTWLGNHFREALHTRFKEQIPTDFSGFMQALMKVNSREYQAINAEAFAWLKWLRHMAAAKKGEQ